MARTLKEIKDEMTSTFVKERAVVYAYDLHTEKSFDQQFSAASIENLIFYAFAFAVWVLETLFDKHAAEVDARIELLAPHTLRWYVNKTKAFMYGYKLKLVEDSDYYDTSGMSETDIEKAQVVKFANATESNTVVYIKVAGADQNGNPVPLPASQLTALRSYMNTVKDAGVSVQIRNEAADIMKVELVVYYDPTLMNANGTDNDAKKPVNDTIRRVITSLPFNGLYRNSDLLAALNDLKAVEVVDIISVQAKAANDADFHNVTGFDRPFSGYYSISDSDIVVTYHPYNTIEAL